MLYRTLLLLSLLTLTLSGCFEDVLSEEEVPPVTEPGRFTFTIDETEERAVRNAYVLTQSVQNGTLFMHHLILTANDVWEDGRLTDTSDAIIVAYVTERPDISADFRTVTGDTEELYGGNDGEILKVNFSFETDGGLNHIAGNYIGEVVSAVRPR